LSACSASAARRAGDISAARRQQFCDNGATRACHDASTRRTVCGGTDDGGTKERLVVDVAGGHGAAFRFVFPRCPVIELYNFLENNRAQIVGALLTRIPKDIPAYSRVARNDLKQSLEYILEAYTDLLVTGDDDSQKTYFKFLAKLRVSQSFKLGDVLHKHLLLLAVVRPMIQAKFRDHSGDGLALYNKAMDVLERTHFQSVALLVQVWTDYVKSRAAEHNEYVDEENKQLGVDMSKFILFRG
jgi:hypothetical protein